MLINKKDPLQLPPADEQAQELYNQFVAAGVKKVTETSDKIVNFLRQSEGDPAESLAQATMLIVPDIRAKIEVPTDDLMQGSIEIMKNIAEFGKAAGITTADDSVMNRAAQLLTEEVLDQFGENEDYQVTINMVGSVDPEEAERIGAEQEAHANGFNQE